MTRMLFGRIAFAGAVSLFVVSCASGPESPEFPAPFEFAVIGDIPYGDEDRAMLQNEILPRIQKANYPFVIHVGDYKAGATPCTAADDEAQLALIAALAPKPVFYTPGDNEWTDCDRNPDPATGKPMSELASLDRVRSLFFSKPVSAPAAMNVRRQKAQPENATWAYARVRFLTLHVVGTNNGHDYVAGDPMDAAAKAAEARDKANLVWLEKIFAIARKEEAAGVVIAMQGDMVNVAADVRGKACTDATVYPNPCDGFTVLRKAIRDEAVKYGGAVLLVHGDTEPFTFDQDFLDESAPNLWRFNAAGDTGVTAAGVPYGFRDASVVSFSPVANPSFSGKGLVTGKAPDPH